MSPFDKKTIPYLTIGIFHLVAISLNWNENITSISKTLLMPTLMMPLLFSKIDKPLKILLLLALFFSWLGDVFLISPTAFLFGVGSFFIAQIIYIISFAKIRLTSVLKNKWFIVLPYLLYLFIFLKSIWANLPEGLHIPLCLYALILCAMVLAAIDTFKNKSSINYIVLVIGAHLFLISDSIIAISRFGNIQDSINFSFWIMITYISAQYLILKGIVNEK